MSSRELSSLADGLNPSMGHAEVLGPFLDIVRERFPGEFWVHFRTAVHAMLSAGPPDPMDREKGETSHREKGETSHRHLTAALAIRPQSAIARAALGSVLIESLKNEQAGIRMLHSAVKADPASPWPHLFVGMHAVEKKDWPGAFRAWKECVRVDPDTPFFMLSATVTIEFARGSDGARHPTDEEIIKFLDELIALHPKHPGGYHLLGQYYRQMGDHRSALATLLKAKPLLTEDYLARVIFNVEVEQLEAKARWEERLPAVLRGEVRPANSAEAAELADYCATFEKRFLLATRFVSDAIKADPKMLDNYLQAAKYAGWAVQAGAGSGADGAALPAETRAEYRRLALQWLRDTIGRQKKENAGGLGFYLGTLRDFASVRDAKELAKLPAEERAAWEKLWDEVKPANQKRKE
jgi:tetratricopeptide (TPR) repeat protein